MNSHSSSYPQPSSPNTSCTRICCISFHLNLTPSAQKFLNLNTPPAFLILPFTGYMTPDALFCLYKLPYSSLPLGNSSRVAVNIRNNQRSSINYFPLLNPTFRMACPSLRNPSGFLVLIHISMIQTLHFNPLSHLAHVCPWAFAQAVLST